MEKKSRFIATLIPVASEEEAQNFINAKKKEFWDARHNCSAFVIGDNNQISRCSDDGEPAGTAGRPLLDMLLKEDLHNACVVVTRYFGGVLLGTGGLVRAYQGALAEAIAAADIIEPQKGYPVKISLEYSLLGSVEYILREAGILMNTEYGSAVEISCIIPVDDFQNISEKITDKTAAAAIITKDEPVAYAVLNNEYHIM